MSERMSSEHRKLCILSAVRGLFCKKGLSATSKEISQTAGVSEALIYKHFGSKEELYKALLDRACRGHEGVGMELAEMEPATEVLVCATYLLVHAMMTGMENPEDEFALTPEEICGLLLQSLQTDGEVARTLFTQGFGPWVQYFESGLEAAKKTGDFNGNDMDFKTLVWMAHHSILGVKMTLHSKPDAFMGKERDIEKLKNQAFNFILRGMGLKQEGINRSLQSDLFKEFKTKIENT